MQRVEYSGDWVLFRTEPITHPHQACVVLLGLPFLRGLRRKSIQLKVEELVSGTGYSRARGLIHTISIKNGCNKSNYFLLRYFLSSGGTPHKQDTFWRRSGLNANLPHREFAQWVQETCSKPTPNAQLQEKRLSDETWVSSVGSNSMLFDKPGIREKHYGQDWAPPKFEFGVRTEVQVKNVNRHVRGEKLQREEFVEAAYVFDPKRWSRVKDLFALEGFFAVKGRLAELLATFDLGDGELVEFPIYEADKITRLPGPYYFLNFGSQKDCFLSKDSIGARLLGKNKITGQELWAGPIEPEDGDIAVSVEARDGADLWIDPKLKGKIFMSGRLHDAIEVANLRIDFCFARTRILPNQQELEA
jgi:uncharacterized protein DUF1629